MSTSGTYAYNPSLGELILYAFNLAGLRNTALTQEHMTSASMAANLLLARWANQGVNLWEVELVTVPLVAGTSTYSVAASTVFILDAYMRIDDGITDPTDRIILPISRSEYASYPNKAMQGFTTVYWHDRLLSPTITLWPVPDGTSAQYLKYYRVHQIQDAATAGGLNVDIPYLWLESFALSLAAQLAVIWAPDRVQMLKPLADEAYKIAADANVEIAQQYISPQVSGYWRV